MKRTKPPCYKDGKDCERRCAEPLCRNTCPEWAAYCAEVEAEREKYNSEKHKASDVGSFLMDIDKRNQRISRTKYQQRRRQY